MFPLLLASRHAETAFLCESFQYFLFLLTLISILLFLLILAPSVNLSVDTFPVSGDGLRFLFFSLCTHLESEYHGKTKIPLPSFLSGGNTVIRSDGKRIVFLGAQRRENAMRRHTRPTGAVRIRHRLLIKSVYNTRILCPDSSLRSRMTGRYLIPFCDNRFFVSAHLFPFFRIYSHSPLPTADAATFPVVGDGLRSAFYRFMATIK